MNLLCNFHCHARGDLHDTFIDYTVHDAIVESHKHNIDVLAITGHHTFLWTREDEAFAKTLGMVLIPGIEISIREKNTPHFDILLLNCTPDMTDIHTFADLTKWKEQHPELFVVLAHPFYGLDWKKREAIILKQSKLFDAIEHSWFYSTHLNPNKKAQRMAKRLNLPFIATSDTHFIEHCALGLTNVLSDSDEIENIFHAIRNQRFERICAPQSNYSLGFHVLKTMFRKL